MVSIGEWSYPWIWFEGGKATNGDENGAKNVGVVKENAWGGARNERS